MKREKPLNISDEELRQIKRRKPTKKEEIFQKQVEDEEEKTRKIVLYLRRKLEKLENS